MKVVVMDSSQVLTVTHDTKSAPRVCYIFIILTKIKRLLCFDQVRRETPKVTDDNDVITLSQRKIGVDLLSALKIACTFSCENSCPDSAAVYAVDVVLAQLQFTASSRE